MEASFKKNLVQPELNTCVLSRAQSYGGTMIRAPLGGGGGYYPARAGASKGLCDRSWCLLYIVIYLQGLFSIFQNTHFQTPISAQEGFSSNLIAFSIP